MKKIPYGKTDFKELITQNCYYVDKTKYLINIENDRDVLTYLRPRRFGKTLFTSMMFYYYDINSKDLFDTLFKDTKIYHEPTPNKNNYYVLRFDFSGIGVQDKNIKEIENDFVYFVNNALIRFNNYYKLGLDLRLADKANRSMDSFITDFESLNLTNKIYIIIDEYDKFTNAILEGNANLFGKILGENGFVRTFYEVMKKSRGSCVERIFITGVCSISLDAMTSGFNISTNISNNSNFNAMTGLLHSEVNEIIREIPKEEREAIFKIMLDNFDGYLFSLDDDENNDDDNDNDDDDDDDERKVFNSTMVMNYIFDYYQFNKLPKKLMDPNMISNYEQIKNIITIKDNDVYQEVLDTIFEKREIEGILKSDFDLKKDITRDDIISLLYYFGLLTIDRPSTSISMIFKIPNKMVDILYNDYYLAILRDYDIIIRDDIVLNGLKEMVSNGTVNRLSNYVSELLKGANSRIFERFSENNIELMYFSMLARFQEFNTNMEYPCGNGYADMVMIGNSKYTKYNIMLEFKYIKKSKKDKNGKVKIKTKTEIEKEIEEKKEEGIKQLKDYSKNLKLDNLRKYLLIFVTSDLRVLEEVC